eukprot:455207_1
MKFGEQMSDLAVASVVFEILQRNGIRSRSRCDKAFTETLSYSRINLKKPVELICDPGSVTGEDLDDSWSEEANQLFEKFRTFHLQIHSQSTREKPVPLSPQFVYDFIKSLVLRKRGISNIGSSILKFSNLQKLNVGDNHIVSLENIPQSLEVLNAYNNRFGIQSPGDTVRYPSMVQHAPFVGFVLQSFVGYCGSLRDAISVQTTAISLSDGHNDSY